MKTLMVLIIYLLSLKVKAENLNLKFINTYFHDPKFSSQELKKLEGYKVLLISGVLAEIVIAEDKSAPVDFSFFTGNYFGEQLKLFKKLGVDAKRISSSSANIEITKDTIKKEIEIAQNENKKVIFMTHSLGGLVLLDYLVESYPTGRENIKGILFLQSPFYGSTIADMYLSDDFIIKKMAGPILPLINLSENTLHYLSVKNRKEYMLKNYDEIMQILKKIPTITISGVSNGQKSDSTTLIEIMHHGYIGKKTDEAKKVIYKGPYDLSDGMVPLRSSLLPFGDTIVIRGLDHTEFVLRHNSIDFDQKTMATSLVKLLLEKINP